MVYDWAEQESAERGGLGAGAPPLPEALRVRALVEDLETGTLRPALLRSQGPSDVALPTSFAPWAEIGAFASFLGAACGVGAALLAQTLMRLV